MGEKLCDEGCDRAAALSARRRDIREGHDVYTARARHLHRRTGRWPTLLRSLIDGLLRRR